MYRLLLPVVCLALTACSHLPLESSSAADSSSSQGRESDVTDERSIDFERSRLIALDFVDAMRQLPELEPMRVTLYTDVPRSRFGHLLIASLQDAGYDLRIGDRSGPGQLRYVIDAESVDNVQSSEGVYTFLISAADVKLKRSYRVDRSGVQPATSMFLHGSAARNLRLNEALFGPQPRAVDKPTSTAVGKQVVTRAVPLPERIVKRAIAVPTPVAAGRAAETRQVRLTATLSDADLSDAAPEPQTADDAIAQKRPQILRNLFETRRSNYQEILADYEVLNKSLMVFPNDSLVMGSDNKRLARQIAAAFDPARDVISVIGCSHGPTALRNGNEVLATGRAARVKEEFVLSGIAGDQVLEEGCWASTHFDKMPARGVVVTHKRRQPQV